MSNVDSATLEQGYIVNKQMNSILSPFNRIKVREPSLIVSEEYYYIRYCTIYIAIVFILLKWPLYLLGPSKLPRYRGLLLTEKTQYSWPPRTS